MNLTKYFNAPVFDSLKSTHIVRWQNEFERRLMTYFDSNSKIKNYFQPLMSVVAKYGDKEYLIDIDFWLEYANGEVNLIHIERENEVLWEMKTPILAKAKEWLKLDGFGFITISNNKLKNVSARKLKIEAKPLIIDINFENSKWLH